MCANVLDKKGLRQIYCSVLRLGIITSQSTKFKSVVFSRALLSTQGMGMLNACVTMNRKINSYSIQEEISETLNSFPNNQ